MIDLTVQKHQMNREVSLDLSVEQISTKEECQQVELNQLEYSNVIMFESHFLFVFGKIIL